MTDVLFDIRATTSIMQKKFVNGVEIAFVERGSGPVLLLVHGFPLDHGMWDTQIEALSRCCRVIAVDLRGFGQSGGIGESVEGGERVVTMEQFADDLAALLDALGIAEPIFLAGLSMGGYVSFQFVLKRPERVRGLILCDTKAMGDTPETAAARRETARRILKEGSAMLVDAMTPRLFSASNVVRRPELLDAIRRVMVGTDPQTVAAASLGMARRPDVRPLLHRIECPALVIVGSEDAISPVDEMREIARGISGSKFVEIAGSGHMSPMEKPEEFNAAVREFVGTTSF